MTTVNLPVKRDDSFRPLTVAVFQSIETLRSTIANQNLPSLGFSRRYAEWKRRRALADFQSRLNRLTDDQLAMLKLDRTTLDLDVAEIYDRHHQETSDLKRLIAEVTGPVPEERRLAA